MSDPRIHFKPQVTIQDVIVTGAGITDIGYPTGEFKMPDKYGGKSPDPNESSESLINRLYSQITSLTPGASAQHATNLEPGTNKLLADKKDNITRLITNEFHFYTKQPLSLNQFEILMNKVNEFAKNHPENLHMILGSFAIMTPEKKVVNVTPHIECGSSPKINLIVKNYPSAIDPVYSSSDENGIETYFFNSDFAKGDRVDHLKINIPGQSGEFTYNNVLHCKSAAGTAYYSCVDVCLDHHLGVGKKRLNESLDGAINFVLDGNVIQPLPTQCSHTVVSNTVSLVLNNVIGGISHADPSVYSTGPLSNTSTIFHSQLTTPYSFGTNSTVTVMAPAVCRSLSQREQMKVNYINEASEFIRNFDDPVDDVRNAMRMNFPSLDIYTDEYNLQMAINKYGTAENAAIAAVTANDNNLLDMILKRYMTVDTPVTPEGDTLLMLAVTNDNDEMVDFLMQLGAKPTVTNELGLTPLAVNGNSIISDIFNNHGYSVQASTHVTEAPPPITTEQKPISSSGSIFASLGINAQSQLEKKHTLKNTNEMKPEHSQKSESLDDKPTPLAHDNNEEEQRPKFR